MISYPTHCTKCGRQLIEKTVLAKDYTHDSISGFFRVGYEEFNAEGWRQELLQFICPSYGEKRGRFFKKTVPHDMKCFEIQGEKYVTKVADHSY